MTKRRGRNLRSWPSWVGRCTRMPPPCIFCRQMPTTGALPFAYLVMLTSLGFPRPAGSTPSRSPAYRLPARRLSSRRCKTARAEEKTAAPGSMFGTDRFCCESDVSRNAIYLFWTPVLRPNPNQHLRFVQRAAEQDTSRRGQNS